MRMLKNLTLSMILMGSQLSIATETGHNHGHEDAGKATSATSAKPAKKFAVDEALKQRMTVVIDTIENFAQNKTHSSQKEHKAQFAEVGTKIETTVQDIFKSCKLTPDADAAIHPILASLLGGASLLKKGNGKVGLNKIHKALKQYEDFFDHSGTTPQQ